MPPVNDSASGPVEQPSVQVNSPSMPLGHSALNGRSFTRRTPSAESQGLTVDRTIFEMWLGLYEDVPQSEEDA